MSEGEGDLDLEAGFEMMYGVGARIGCVIGRVDDGRRAQRWPQPDLLRL